MPSLSARRRTLLLPLALLSTTASLGVAQRDSTRNARPDSAASRSLSVIRVMGRADDLTGIASTASQGHIGSADLRLRPLMREGELLETVPERDYYTVEVPTAAEPKWESPAALAAEIASLEATMKEAAKRLDFERAAELRDRIKALRKVDLDVRGRS